MRIGKLRHIGTIEKHSNTTDEAGGVTKTWTEFKKVWCDIKPLNGNEKYVSQEKHATATHQVIVRFTKGIDTKMRLVSRGRIFEIKSVLNVNEQDKMLQLVVEEEADANN